MIGLAGHAGLSIPAEVEKETVAYECDGNANATRSDTSQNDEHVLPTQQRIITTLTQYYSKTAAILENYHDHATALPS